jgi:hypothetical protein
MAAQIRDLSDLISRCSKEGAPGMNLDRIDGLSRHVVESNLCAPVAQSGGLNTGQSKLCWNISRQS